MSWIDSEFLEKALRSGVDPNLTVISSEVKPATAAGDNYGSEMCRAFLKVKRGGREEDMSVIIKVSINFELTDDANEQKRQQFDIYNVESSTFTEVLPAMYNLFGGKYQPFSAKHFYSHAGLPANAIVLEDLKSSGFRLAEPNLGLDLKHCLLVMRTIARYHAASLVLHHKDPNCFALFEKNAFTQEESDKVFKVLFSSSVNGFREEMEKWEDYKGKYSDKLRYLADNATELWQKAVKADKNGFNVLTHGDLWMNNMMFRYSEETGEVQDIRFVDYQLTHWASPAVDLMYFFNSSAAPEVLEQRGTLIKEYHSKLCASLSELGHQNLQPSLEVINKEMEDRVVYGVLAAIVIKAFAFPDRSKIPDPKKVIKEEGSFHLSVSYKESLRKLWPLYEKWGWLNI